MATESQSLTSSPVKYSDLTTFREVFSKLSSETKGAHRCVRDASAMRHDRDYTSLMAKAAFACVEEQTVFLCHVWSSAYPIDDDMRHALKAIAQAGATFAFLDVRHTGTQRAIRLAQSIAVSVREQLCQKT